jgi:MFS family permease
MFGNIILISLLLIISHVALKIVIILAIAASLGTGLSSAFTYFWNSTRPEERGRIAGLIGAVVLPLGFAVSYLIIPSLDFTSKIVLIIVINLGGAATLAVLIQSRAPRLENKIQIGNNHEKRTVLLYLIPWIVFSLINVTIGKNASTNVSAQTSMSFHLFLLGLQFLGVILGAVIGGTVSDIFGRRLALASGLTLYGTSAALTGLFTSNEMFSFVYLTNGLSWGFLFALYMFVIWGDLANNINCAKIYSLGLATYFLSSGLGFLIPVSVTLAVGSLVSCLLVFVLNMPIALAPELLPAEFSERTKLIRHMGIVRKIKKQNQG